MLKEKQCASEKELRMGLCSKSQMGYILSGERLPDYQIRNRLMGRLGVSAEGYADFINYEEYERRMNSELLIELVEKQKTDEAKDLYLKLLKSWKRKNIIEKQFLLDMKARILMQYKVPNQEIYGIYKQIISIYNDVEDIFSNNSILISPDEAYYLVRYLEYYGKISSDLVIEDIAKKYEQLYELIITNYNRDITKAKIIPMLVCKYYEFYLSKMDVCEERERKIYELSQVAIDTLRDSASSYYLIELINVRQNLQNSLQTEILNKTSELEQNVHDTYIKLLKKYRICDMEYDGYIYRSSEIYNISSIIKSRRKAFGMSREELSEGICSVRTLERIEAEHSKGQLFVIVGLLKKLNIDYQCRRYNIITSDKNAIMAVRNCKRYINDRDFISAKIECDKLSELVSMDYIINRQVVNRLNSIIELYSGCITKEEYQEKMREGIELSIPWESIDRLDTFYTTETEFMMLYHYNMIRQEKNTSMCRFCEKCKHNKELYFNTRYRMLLEWYADKVLANSGQYKESTSLFECICFYSLTSRRPYSLGYNLYNVAWNKMKEQDFDDDIALKKIDKQEPLYLAQFWRHNSVVNALKID